MSEDTIDGCRIHDLHLIAVLFSSMKQVLQLEVSNLVNYDECCSTRSDVYKTSTSEFGIWHTLLLYGLYKEGERSWTRNIGYLLAYYLISVITAESSQDSSRVPVQQVVSVCGILHSTQSTRHWLFDASTRVFIRNVRVLGVPYAVPVEFSVSDVFLWVMYVQMLATVQVLVHCTGKGKVLSRIRSRVVVLLKYKVQVRCYSCYSTDRRRTDTFAIMSQDSVTSRLRNKYFLYSYGVIGRGSWSWVPGLWLLVASCN
jgi:hypothetical protein